MLAINKMIIGGAEQQFLELVKGLDKKRFRPIVVTLEAGGDLEKEIQSIPGIEIFCLNRRSKYNFSLLFAVLHLLRKKHVDIIQPFLTPATFFVLLPSVLSRTPVRLVTERGSLLRPGLGYGLYLRIEDFFTRFADWVIPNSESGRNYLIERGIKPERIKVIYNGINIQRLTPDPAKVNQIRDSLGLAANRVLIGISASLTPLKDHATFLRAAQLISQIMPQARFAILGDGPLRSNLEDLAKELGIGSCVMFLGNQKEVSPYLSVFDIVCLCSAEAEGCSNAILEAMALGKPMVATNVGGNRELVENGKTGLLVQVRDPQALANAILSCIRQPDRAREMGRRAREMVLTRFGLDRMVHDYETIYEEIIKLKRKGNHASN
jgi:glycosyltransferase involved in cell wall biosynthesis